MKYIRTKDGLIYEVYAKRGTIVECVNGKSLILIDEKDSLNQADTIEELCDEFIVITEAYRKVGSYYDCEYEIERYKNKIKSNNPIIAIYAAIWTDKGLIYVAKMNEEGELELL